MKSRTFSAPKTVFSLASQEMAQAAVRIKREHGIPIMGFDHPGRAFVAHALLARYGGSTDDDKKAIEDAVAALKKTLEDEGSDAEKIAADTQAMLSASMKLGEAMYKQQAESDAAQDAARDAAGDDVVDAEFTEVDDDKNKKSA